MFLVYLVIGALQMFFDDDDDDDDDDVRPPWPILVYKDIFVYLSNAGL